MTKQLFRVLLTMTLALGAYAANDYETVFPAKADPFVGNWVGRWSEDVDVSPDVSAQVVALGRDKYQIRIADKLFQRCAPLAIIEVKLEEGVLAFRESGLQGKIEGDSFTGGKRPGRSTFEMTKYEHRNDRMGAAPPQGAQLLFDGSTLDAWEGVEGWKILPDGTLMVTPDGGYLVSKGRWKDVQVHVEFRTSFMPKARGQARGNSGVFVQDVYEVQVLDSFGLEGYYNECGGLYKVMAPQVNACLPPLTWQTYDITYRAPRFDAQGKVTEYPRITVDQNGVRIHLDQEMKQITAWKEKERLGPLPTEAGPIRLQGHNNYVQFRNIWIVDLEGIER
jgi:hypothetical protein